MAVFTLEDAQGGVEVIAFPEVYQRSASLIESGTMILVRGKLERDDETVRVLASEIIPIEGVRERLAREVAIRVRLPAGTRLFEALGEIFSRHRGDRRVSFEMELRRPAPQGDGRRVVPDPGAALVHARSPKWSRWWEPARSRGLRVSRQSRRTHRYADRNPRFRRADCRASGRVEALEALPRTDARDREVARCSGSSRRPGPGCTETSRRGSA